MDAKTKALLDKVKPQPVAAQNKHYKGFLYGEYGVGKTILCADLVKKKGLVIATDTGSESLHNHPDLLEKIDIVPYEGLSHLTAIAQAVEEGDPDYVDYDVVWIDTLSQIQEEYLDWLNDNYTFAGKLREKATARNLANIKRDGLPAELETIGLADYKLARDNMRHPIKSLIKAPVNVVFVAHLREPNFMELDKGKMIRRPTVTDAVFKLVAREASWMGLMERDGAKRTVQFMTDKKTVSKSRIAELDDKILDANKVAQILKEWSV